MLRYSTIAVLIAGSAAISGSPAFAAQLPDATYRCQFYSGGMTIHMGDIAIAGTTYQGPANDGNYAGTYDYEMTDAGAITWKGPMGGYSSGGNTIVSTVVTDNGGRPAFDILVQVPDGDFQPISCLPQ